MAATLCGLALLSMPAAVRAAVLYDIEPDFVSIGFAVDHLGLFTTTGHFRQFDGTLLLDLAHPDQSRVEVTVNVGSATTSSLDADRMLRSPAYFDVAQFPAMHFATTSVVALTLAEVRLEGDLTIRGVTRPAVFEARLEGRRHDDTLNAEVADFVAVGKVDRVAYGMIADRDFVADQIDIRISAHIRLQPDPPDQGPATAPTAR